MTTTVATSGPAHCAGSPLTIASPAAGRPAGVEVAVTSNCASTSSAAYTPTPAPDAAAGALSSMLSSTITASNISA